jgi:hypothetical protein
MTDETNAQNTGEPPPIYSGDSGVTVTPGGDVTQNTASAPDSSGEDLQPVRSGLTHAQQREIAEQMIRLGQLTPEQAEEMLANEGAEPLASEPDTEIDRFFPPPQSATDYDLSPLMTEHEYEAAEAVEFGSLMLEARIPAGVGSELVRHAVETAQRTEEMSDAARSLWAQSEYHDLIRIFGKGEESILKEKLALARGVLEDLEKKRPGLREELATIGALDSCQFVGHLIQHGERMAARQAELKGR